MHSVLRLVMLVTIAAAIAPASAGADTLDTIIDHAVDLLNRRLGGDLSDAELAEIEQSCSWRRPTKKCGLLVARCALPGGYELGSNLHRACDHLNAVLPHGALILLFHADVARVSEPAALRGADYLVTGGASARLLIQRLRLVLRGDLRAGTTNAGGFALDGSVGGGVGTTLGRSAAAGFTTGVGGSGVSGDHQPPALLFPVEVFVSGAVGGRGQGVLWARADIPTLSSRRSAGTGPFDEWRLGAAFGLSANEVWLGHASSSGPFLGVELQRTLGTTLIALVLGWGSLSHGGGPS